MIVIICDYYEPEYDLTAYLPWLANTTFIKTTKMVKKYNWMVQEEILLPCG